jgi:hypothetical protein
MEKKVPSVAQYVVAFRKIESRVNESQLAMLKKHYAAPGRAITATSLGTSVGFEDYRGVNRWYGELGTILAEAMGFDWRPESTVAVSMLELFVKPGSASNTEYVLVMRENVARALEQLEWVDNTSDLFMPPGYDPSPTE